MRFPQTFLDDLKRQADIVRVVQDYVSLKKKGANWMACCPFHQEKSPSFSVNPSREMFYCFGCQKGGGVFNFVMEMEHVTFPEAVKIVAEKSGVALPALVEDDKFESRRRDADEIVQLNTWALEWWEQQYQEGTARGAREYVESRGITDETRRTFRLGFAPDSWDALSSYLKSKGATAAQIERSGLVVKKDAGGFYDRFRGRVIFPVLDAQGRAVAFGARVLPGGGEPKYLNSPETAAYTKGRHLYGLHQNREEIRKKKFVILVEGYLDVIVPYQFGVRNCVASLGTSLTAEQARLMSRFARRVVVNYDGDRAGVAAAKRAIEVLLPEDFEVKVLVLPDGADPDEFLRARGADEYNERRGASLPHIQFVLDQAVSGRNLRKPADKAAAVEEALPFVRAVKNRIQRREYFDMTMDALRVEEPSLRRELWRAVAAPPGASAVADAADVQRKIARAEAVPLTVAEQRLLELLAHDAELRREILPRLEEDDYRELPSARVFEALREIEREGLEVNFETLGSRTEGDAAAADLVPVILMGESARAEGEAADDTLAEAESCLAALKVMSVEHRLKELAAAINEAERAGDDARRDALVLESLDLTRRRNVLLPRT
ncbi:MAG: DNA primase [Acidobacteria bacterium]|nr:DNA primase [Acidobacteriota bacterium]MCA1643115.1 DNA primase [Acidobacteriota bacterium]